MHQGAHDGVQDSCDGKRDGDKVERHGKCDVLLDGPHHLAGKSQQVRDFGNVVADKRHVGSLDSDARADSAHGNPYERRLECGSVVDSVANHRNFVLGGTVGSSANETHLVFGGLVRVKFVNVQFVCSVGDSRQVVAGKQYRGDAQTGNIATYVGRVFAERVLQGMFLTV